MLALKPGLMTSLPVRYLVLSLESEPSIMRTPVELELMRRCEMLEGELRDRCKILEDEVRDAESALEQSEFRAQLILEIIKLCDTITTKKDLVAAIKRALENSYVEL